MISPPNNKLKLEGKGRKKDKSDHSLARTKKALARFDRIRARCFPEDPKHPGYTLPTLTPDTLWKSLDAAILRVKEAFAKDSADVNPRYKAMLVSPRDPWLRRLVEKYG